MIFKKALCVLFGMAFVSGSISALDWNRETHLSLTGGYRHDKLDSLIDTFDPSDTFIFSDSLEAKNLNVYEIGVKGNIGFCDNWFIKGFVDYGQVTCGSYLETVSAPGFISALEKAKVHNGNTKDVSIGLGYLFSFWEDGLKIGPVVGYAYDYQKIKIHKATFEGVPDPILNGLRFNNRWQGPWVGCDTRFAFQCVDFSLGYEYHWCHWHADWQLDGPDVIGGAFSDRRKSHHASGNVVYLDGLYSFCECWDIGLGFKYQFWRATHGREVPRAGSFTAIGLSPTEVDKVPKSSWYSYQIQLSLGHNF